MCSRQNGSLRRHPCLVFGTVNMFHCMEGGSWQMGEIYRPEDRRISLNYWGGPPLITETLDSSPFSAEKIRWKEKLEIPNMRWAPSPAVGLETMGRGTECGRSQLLGRDCLEPGEDPSWEPGREGSLNPSTYKDLILAASDQPWISPQKSAEKNQPVGPWV